MTSRVIRLTAASAANTTARHLIGKVTAVLDAITFLTNIDTTTYTSIACELSQRITQRAVGKQNVGNNVSTR